MLLPAVNDIGHKKGVSWLTRILSMRIFRETLAYLISRQYNGAYNSDFMFEGNWMR